MPRAFCFVVAFGSLMLLSSAAAGQLVEAPYMVALTASFSQEIPSGSRIARIRVTTKDLIEDFKEQLGVTGRKGRLVMRRDLSDPDSPEAGLYLLLDGVYYQIENFIEPLPLFLPEGFYGRATSHVVNRRTGALSSAYGQEVTALAMGDLAVDGFQMGLFSLDSAWVRPVEPVPGAPLLFRRFMSQVTGGMEIAGIPLDAPMLITGRLLISAERVLSP